MKHILRYDNFQLNEGTADIVFHFTYTHKMINILKDNTMNLSPAVGIHADEEKNKGKFYYLSLTTTGAVNTGYAASLGKNGIVRIVLNGRMIKHNFKTSRVDYWNMHDFRTPNGTKDSMYQAHRFNEMEDRIFSDKSHIDNISKYIIRIDVLSENEISDGIKHLKYQAEKLNIPINVYRKQDHINLNLIDKAVEVESLPEYESNDRTGFSVRRIMSLLAHKNDNMDNVLAELKNKFDIEQKPIIRPEYELMGMDFLNGLSADIQNVRSTGTKAERFILNELFKDMKRYKTNNIKAYMDYKYWLNRYSPKQAESDILAELKVIHNDTIKYLDDFLHFYDENDNQVGMSKHKAIKFVLDKKITEITELIKNNNILDGYETTVRTRYKIEDLIKLSQEDMDILEEAEFNGTDKEEVISDFKNRLFYLKYINDTIYDIHKKLNQ